MVKFDVPAYTAVMERAPADVFVVLNVATPAPFRLTFPSVALPSLNATAPLGVTPVAEVTDAEYVTDCPYVEGFSEEVTVEVVVASLFTVCVRIGDVLLLLSVLPP